MDKAALSYGDFTELSLEYACYLMNARRLIHLLYRLLVSMNNFCPMLWESAVCMEG